MVDRLEELLALMGEEDDEDKREDEWTAEPGTEAPAPPVPDIHTEKAPEEVDPVLAEDERMPAEAMLSQRTPDGGNIPLERREKAGAEADETVELWDGLTAVVTGRNGAALLRRPGAGDVSLAELAGVERRPGAAEVDVVMESMTSAERGLEGLYKQTVQAARPAAQAMPAGQAGHTFRAEEPGRTAALTVEELDRAVRRDSRRYDGGMTIF